MARVARSAHATETARPAYEPLEHALTPKAQLALRNLQETYSLRKLQGHVIAANGAVTETAGEINDRLMAQQEYLRKRRVKRDKQGGGGGTETELDREKEKEDEKKCDELKEQVESMTGELEASTRKLIDIETQTMNIDETLKDLANSSVTRGGGAMSWPGVSSSSNQGSRGRRARRIVNGGEDEDDSSEMDVDVPAKEVEQVNEHPGLVRPFQKELQTKKDRYEGLSKRQRWVSIPNFVSLLRPPCTEKTTD